MTHDARGRTTVFVALTLAVLALPYVFRLGDVPLIKVDEMWGAQPSWEIWTHGRFALPAFKGHLHQDVATFFHPPGYYIVNAPFIGLLRPSTWSVRVAPTLFALLSFVMLYFTLRRLLAGLSQSRPLALAGVALAAWNPLTFALSRHGRPETWILLLATCSVLLALRDPDVAPATPARPSWLPMFAAGLLSGYAFFSHYWAFVLPGVLAMWLVQRRAWRALAWYALGTSVFVAVTAGWILANRADFTAELLWHRGSYLAHSAQGYLQKRFADHLAILGDARAACTWWLEISLIAALMLPGTRAMRWRTLGLLAVLHLLLILFPRPSAYYTVAIVYFCAGAIPVALAHAWRHTQARSWMRPALVAGLAAVIAVPAALLGYMIWRDRDASYAAAFRPLREAVDRADPQRTGITVGSEIQYFAFWDRPFLIRWNPYLWRDATSADSLVGRWRSIGVRFVLTSSLMPRSTALGPLAPELDRAFVDRLRASGRTLARSGTYYYGEPEHKYEDATVEVIDIGAAR